MLWAAACTPIDAVEEGFSAPACTSGTVGLAEWQTVEPVDFIELRELTSDWGQQALVHSTPVMHRGAACATASTSRCADDLARVAPSAGFALSCGKWCRALVFIVTRGDLVTELTSASALAEFVRPVDAAQEATWLAIAAGYEVSCDDLSSGAVRAVDDGFEVLAAQGHVCGEGTHRDQVRLHVSREGLVREVARHTVSIGHGQCQPLPSAGRE